MNLGAGGTARRTRTTNPFPDYRTAQRKSKGRVIAEMGESKSRGYTPSDEDMKVMAYLHRHYDPVVANMNNHSYHRMWWTQIAYLAGLQSVRWDATTKQFVKAKLPTWKSEYVANRIMPLFLRMQSRLTVDGADFRSIPKSASEFDIDSSRLAEKLLEHAKHVTDRDDVRADAITWAITCGSGFVKETWNPTIGGKRKLVDENGEETEIELGDLECRVCSPFQIRVPPLIEEVRDMPWIVQQTTMHVEELRRRYPERGDFVAPQSVAEAQSRFENLVHSVMGKLGLRNEAELPMHDDYVEVIELWTKPTHEWPEGLRAVYSNGVVLESGPNPYHRWGWWLPFSHYRYAKIPGRFWGMALVELLIDPQREYNKARQQIIENKDLMSRPKWLVANGSGLKRGSMTSRPGEIIVYNPAVPKPEQTVQAPLPNYVMDHLQSCLTEMNDMAASQEVSEGKAPASLRSGAAIRLLQEADLATIGSIKRRHWKEDREAAERMLAMCRDMYREPRVMELVGEEHGTGIRVFTGADLRGHRKFIIRAESAILDSKAARQQTVLDYVQLGVLDPTNPLEKIEILKALEIGGTEQLASDRLADERMAQAENGRFADPNEALWEARDFEDHETHLRVHNRFRKSIEYRLMDVERQKQVDAHCEQHQAYLQAMIAAQQAAVDSTKGAPGEKGKPSAPNKGPKGES